MTTTFTIDGNVLEAMLAFCITTRDIHKPTILLDVLVEVLPKSVRLVATDTHVLGLLHLTPIHDYHLNIDCDQPTSLVLPIREFKSVLKENKFPVTVTIDGANVTIMATSGMSLTLSGLPAEDFPCYKRVLNLDTPITPIARIAYDVTILAKFAAFAKKMGQPPHIELAFHGVTNPTNVRIADLPGFFGVLMPRQMAYENPIPEWRLPTEQLASEPPRIIRLHDLDGEDTFTGTDEEGCVWTQFVVDVFAEEKPGICAICGAELLYGWTNIDNRGEEICDCHIQKDEAKGEIILPEHEPDVIPA